MMCFICLVIGLLIGGIATTLMMCVTEINRENHYERRIHELKEELSNERKKSFEKGI